MSRLHEYMQYLNEQIKNKGDEVGLEGTFGHMAALGEQRTLTSARDKLYEFFPELAPGEKQEISSLFLKPGKYHPDTTVPFKIPVEDYKNSPMSCRAYTPLYQRGIRTIQELLGYSEKELLEIRCVGPKVINEIKDMLAERGLKLRE